MRTLTLFAVLLVLQVPTASGQAAHPPSAKPATQGEGEATPGRSLPAHLVGAWKSAPDRIALTSAFDESVWGKNATSVRTVDLTVQPSGRATLTVVRKVLNARGVAVPGSTSIERATLVIGAAREPVASRIEYETMVESAERRYPDMPDSKWSLDGLKVTLATLQGEENKTVEVRFDTPEGRGSFWETLQRAGAAGRSGARAAAPAR